MLAPVDRFRITGNAILFDAWRPGAASCHSVWVQAQHTPVRIYAPTPNPLYSRVRLSHARSFARAAALYAHPARPKPQAPNHLHAMGLSGHLVEDDWTCLYMDEAGTVRRAMRGPPERC